MANEGNIRLVTYPGSTVTPLDDAVVYDAAIGTSGIFHGCAATLDSGTAGTIHIAAGHGVIRGRKFTVEDCVIDVSDKLATTGTQTGNILIKLDLSGGDKPPISFEAHMPRVNPSDENNETTRKQNDPNFDISKPWTVELCTYSATTSGVTKVTNTAAQVSRVTRIYNQTTKKWGSGAVTMDKNWVGLDKVDNTEDKKKEVLSATRLANPMEIDFTGAFEAKVRFDGANKHKLDDGTTMYNPLTVKTKFSYIPSFAYLKRELKLTDKKNLTAYFYRAGGIVNVQLNTDALTGTEWVDLANGKSKILLNPTDKDMKLFLPHRLMRQTIPLANRAVQATPWVRINISKEGLISFTTNASKDKIGRDVVCIWTWIADDCDANSGWVWS